MPEFLHGWRRKAGVVTLVMAVVLTSVWIRGEFAPISIKFQIGPRQHWLTTNTGRLIWVSADKVKGMSLLEEENSSTVT